MPGRGQPFKYIVTTEYGKRGGVHHHLIINTIDGTTQIVNKAWKCGRPHFTPLDDTGDYKDLAEYLIKETAERFREPDNPMKTRYSCSRNLERPKPVVEKVHAKRWAHEPKSVKGYYIVKDSVVNGFNPVTGHEYQYYTMAKLGGDSG